METAVGGCLQALVADCSQFRNRRTTWESSSTTDVRGSGKAFALGVSTSNVSWKLAW